MWNTNWNFKNDLFSWHIVCVCVCDILVSLQQTQVLFRVKEISILFPRVDIQSGSIHSVNPNKDYVLCIKASKCQKH